MNTEQEKKLILEMLGVIDGKCDVQEMIKLIECMKQSVILMAEQAGMKLADYRPQTVKQMTLCRRCRFNSDKDDPGTFKCGHMLQKIEGGIYDVYPAVDDGCTFGLERDHYIRGRK